MFKVLEGCKSPERATKYSAAVDLFAAEDVVIGAGETAKVRLGVCINEDYFKSRFLPRDEKEIQHMNQDLYHSTLNAYNHFLKSHYLQLEPRSSLRAKGLIAGTGIIDLDFVYPNEICIILHNPVQLYRFVQNCENRTVLAFDDDVEFKISKGEKIAQIMLCEHKSFLLGYESDTERISGFGSTGK